jgi:lysophospholipase L1-like esterase
MSVSPSATVKILTNVGDPLMSSDGTPLAGATLTFQLVDFQRKKVVSVFDVVSGELVSSLPITAITNAAGEIKNAAGTADIALWPNSRGDVPTCYKVTCSDPAIQKIYIIVDEAVDTTLLSAKLAYEIGEGAISLPDMPTSPLLDIAIAATAGDRVQTGLDRVQTALDRVATGQDKTATAADRVQTALDRVATGQDKTATAADRVQTALDRTSTTESASASAASAALVQPQLTAFGDRVDAVEVGQSAAVIGYATQAALYADLVPDDKSVAYVTNDATSANNGTYRKSGATGIGAWVQSSFDRVALVEGRAATLESGVSALATIGQDVSITVNMTAKTITGGGGPVFYKGGYTVIPLAQNVAFAYTNPPGYAMFLYADKITGVLGIAADAARPPVGSVLLGFIYAQKIYANDPTGQIRVIPTSYGVVGGFGERWGTYTGNIGGLTINQQSKTITTDSTGGALVHKGGLVTIPGGQNVSYIFATSTNTGYLFAHPVTGDLNMTDLGALPPVGFPVIGMVKGEQFYSISPSRFIKYINAGGTLLRVDGLSQWRDLFGMVGSDVDLTINLAAKTVTTSAGGGLILSQEGYVSLAGSQNVSFTHTSANYLLYVYADKTTGILAAIQAPGTPPVNSVLIAMSYSQKLYANDPYGKITLRNAAGVALPFGPPDALGIISKDVGVTINLATKLVTTVSTTNAAVFFKDGYVYVPSAQSVSFAQTLPTYLLYVYIDKTTGVVAAVQLTPTFPANSVCIAIIYGQQIYANDPYKRISLYDGSGDLVTSLAGGLAPFNELAHRLILPDAIYFLPNTPLALFKAPCFSAYQFSLMSQLRLWLDTKGSTISSRFQSVDEVLRLDPAQLGSTFELGFRHESQPDVRYIKPIVKNVSAEGALTGRNLKMLVIGDSLTEGLMADAIQANLNVQGATVTPVGTYFAASTNYLRGEGRGFWNYRSFIGKDNYSTGIGAHTRSSGGKTDTTKFENPFLKLADATDKSERPDWCFRFTGVDRELSYTADTDKTGNFYIFDFAWYLAQHSVDTPEFITIALSTNDINLDTGVYSKAERLQYMRLGLEIMVKQIKTALPNVVIGVIPAPAWSSTTTGDPRWQDETAAWIENCMSDVRALAVTYTKLYVVPVWPFMSEDFAYPYVTETDLSAVNKTQKKTIADWVHFDAAGRAQYAEIVGAWVANVV